MSSTAPPAFWLSMHAGYACRDRGACCSAGWPIPIERPQARAVQEAVARERVQAPAIWLHGVPGQPADVAGLLATDRHGGCVFHRSRSCEIQSALGHAALPSCCQHFPRDCVIDGRGVFVTLSHYCPTAAGLLFSQTGPIEIVSGPPPVPDGKVEGLDARNALPPLLTRGVLMDPEGLSAWEGHLVAWLGGCSNPDGRVGPESTLELLAADAKRLSTWRPGGLRLADAVRSLNDRPPTVSVDPDWALERELRALAKGALPPSYTWPADPDPFEGVWNRLCDSWRGYAAVINRFLAAHAFASWTAYQGDDVVSGIRRLRLALAVLRAEVARACAGRTGDVDNEVLEEGIRQTDLLLVHLVDRQELSDRLSALRR